VRKKRPLFRSSIDASEIASIGGRFGMVHYENDVIPESEVSSRFLKKAAQKLLFSWARGAETSTAQVTKVFLLLFGHKK
jgi:hypothetical protein